MTVKDFTYQGKRIKTIFNRQDAKCAKKLCMLNLQLDRLTGMG